MSPNIFPNSRAPDAGPARWFTDNEFDPPRTLPLPVSGIARAAEAVTRPDEPIGR
jgi:hypothetical protein